MIYLQVPTPAVTATTKLLDYGLLGLIAVILLGVIYYMEKQRSESNSETKLLISGLNAKVDAQQLEQEKQQEKHVEFITGEYRRSMEINVKCLEILEEVKELLVKQRH